MGGFGLPLAVPHFAHLSSEIPTIPRPLSGNCELDPVTKPSYIWKIKEVSSKSPEGGGSASPWPPRPCSGVLPQIEFLPSCRWPGIQFSQFHQRLINKLPNHCADPISADCAGRGCGNTASPLPIPPLEVPTRGTWLSPSLRARLRLHPRSAWGGGFATMLPSRARPAEPRHG